MKGSDCVPRIMVMNPFKERYLQRPKIALVIHILSTQQIQPETPSHLLCDCTAYSDLREGRNPELVLEDRAVFLTRDIARRKQLEQKMRNN